MTTQIPEHVKKDLNDGFEMTDIEDGFQRYKMISETTLLFRCDVNDEVFEVPINLTKKKQ
jgi:hypothetical protein